MARINARWIVVCTCLALMLAATLPAWAADGAAPKKKARLLLVTKGNKVLEAFFSTDEVKKVADVQRLGPDDLKDEKYLKPAGKGAFDLVIFDRCAPERQADLPAGNTFFIGTPPPPLKTEVRNRENVGVRSWDDKDPIIKDVVKEKGLKDSLMKIKIAETILIQDLPKDAKRLIDGDRDTPLLFSLQRQGRTDLVLTFALINDKGDYNTDWPLKVSFPIFLHEVLYKLGNIEGKQ